MTPADALAHKYLAIAEAERLLASRADEPADDDTSGEIVRSLQALRDLGPHAEVFYVSAEMTALAKSAARTLPRTTRSAGLLRAVCGFILFDAPIFHVHRGPDEKPTRLPERFFDIQAWLWAASPRGSKPAFIGIMPLVWAQDKPVLIPAAMATYPMGEDVGSDEGTDTEQPETRFWTAHLLMSQNLAAVTEEPAPRQLRRQLERAGRPPARIKVVTLRLIDRPHRDGDGDGPDWTHRWLVDGHWRQHWYPKAQEHRPLWIGTHVKGPPDKPLVVKEKVTAWIR